MIKLLIDAPWLIASWVGTLVMIVFGAIGIVLIVLNARRLLDDWPRTKPVHNVDGAWIQVYGGLVLVLVAWWIYVNPLRTLGEDVRMPVSAETAQQQAAQATK